MSLLNEKTAWRLVAGGAAFTGAVAAHWVIKGAWKAWTEEDPPENPADPTVGWGEALAWTALAGAVAGMARMLAMRAASTSWTRATGGSPPF